MIDILLQVIVTYVITLNGSSQFYYFCVPILDMGEQEQAQTTPSRGSRSPARAQCRRMHRDQTYFYNDLDLEPEVIREIPRVMQNE